MYRQDHFSCPSLRRLVMQNDSAPAAVNFINLLFIGIS
jgi:hypothetical protein